MNSLPILVILLSANVTRTQYPEAKSMIETLKTKLQNETDASAVEYCWIAALFSVAVMGAMGSMGVSLQALFNAAGS